MAKHGLIGQASLHPDDFITESCRRVDGSFILSVDRTGLLVLLHRSSVGIHCSILSSHRAVCVVKGLFSWLGRMAGVCLGPLEMTWAVFFAIQKMAATHPRIFVWLPVCSSAKQNGKKTLIITIECQQCYGVLVSGLLFFSLLIWALTDLQHKEDNRGKTEPSWSVCYHLQ